MHGFHGLEYRSGLIAANSTGLSLPSSWRENSLLQVFARAHCGIVARGHRLAWLFTARIPSADKYCLPVGGVGVDDIRQVVFHVTRALHNPS
jgi:hypothetical protein